MDLSGTRPKVNESRNEPTVHFALFLILNPRTPARTAIVGVTSDYFGGDDKFNVHSETNLGLV
jgi:hypothetical protein